MKNKIYDSFDRAIEDVFDGAVIGHSIFGTASQALMGPAKGIFSSP